MSGEDDPIQKARARILEEAAARAAAEAAEKFDRDLALFRDFAEQHPDVAATVLKSSEPAPEPPAAAEAGVQDTPQTLVIVNDLVSDYRTDPKSGYQKLRYRTRVNYESQLRRIESDLGPVSIATLDTARVSQIYKEWTARGEAIAHNLISQLRILASYGAKSRHDRACRELKLTLHEMRFPPKSRDQERETLTREQVNNIRAKAHEMNLPSIALAQAIQFECMLRQKDVIGEWVPINDGGTSEVIFEDMKWVRGLRWSSIDQNLILRHTKSQTQKDFVFDLRRAPMVIEELGRLRERPTTHEPMIIDNRKRRPYKAHQFRRMWRKVADAAGVPPSVKNMDSRPDDDERPRRASNREGLRQ
jgi:hypothetical protein